jgi:hypothetical protein
VLAEVRSQKSRSSRNHASRHQIKSNNRIQLCLMFLFGRKLRLTASKPCN